MYRNVFKKSFWIYFGKYTFVVVYTVLLCVLGKYLVPYPENAGIILWFVISALFSIGEMLITLVIYYMVFSEFREFVRKGVAMFTGFIKKGR